MRTLRTLRALSLPLFATLAIATTGVIACGGGGQGSGSSPTCKDFSCADAGTGLSDDGGYAPPAPVDAACVANGGADLPDDDFADSNCDGIDGDRAHAIFVAPAGNDSSPGALETPLKTIAKALTIAASSHKDVYVCTGTYAENVAVAQGVGIYGGYDCTHGWQRTNDRATIAPSKGIPLSMRDVASAVTIDRVTLKAADAYDASASSIAALVVRSANVTLNHASLEAGRGADGAMPDPPKARTGTATAGGDGQALPPITCSLNATAQPAACSSFGAAGFRSGDFTHEGLGGQGGRGGNIRMTPGDAHPGGSGGPSGLGGTGGVGVDGFSGLPGTDGASGKSAMVGVGAFNADGYVASNVGADGAAGSPGGGGGGGAGGATESDGISAYCVGGGGGQGGYGGAGGDAAKGSGAGGASIALVAIDSAVSLVRTQIATSTGGRGGASVSGAPGQLGGAGGKGGVGTVGVRFAHDCDAHSGGFGAHGGGGGAGGAGGGGPAIGIFSNAASPKTSGVTFNIGTAGRGGSGAVSDGADGVTAEIMAASVTDGGATDAGDAGH